MKRRDNLKGERGLITAIIDQATKDALSLEKNDPDYQSALRYFRSELYTYDMQALGLPCHWRPDPD